MTETLNTHVFFVLDKSNSPEQIKDEILKNFNLQIDMLKSSQTKKMKTTVSLSICNSDLNHVFFNKDIFEVPKLEHHDFLAKSNDSSVNDKSSYIFSILDAAAGIQNIEDENTSCILVLLSDNKESLFKTSGKEIQNRIQSLQNTGRWTFTYIAANQDLNILSKTLGIPKGNMLKYESNSFGLNEMIAKHVKYLGSYFMARSYGTKCTRGFYGSDS
jgi:hypothetical protein